ncbi:MAG: hypothetical protein FE047_00640 [Thermoplasmata archaeon]|nr:MAG: hypothetical protein FE047_00640 [Thermoplasmata archaeon]KAA0015311.1 MAG: hypothetical protein FE041_00225 [Thermoplasmata archaeon]
MIDKIVELWLDISPYLLLGMLIAGLLHVYLGTDFIRKHLGKGIKNIFKASLLGVPLPVCSCGVIPIASSLRRDGASKSSTLSFLVSTPTTGVDSIFATYSLLGPLFAIFRPLFALFAGIFTGLVSYFTDKKEEKEIFHEHEMGQKAGLKSLKEAFHYGFFELSEDIGKWLLIGIIAGGIIASIPIDFAPIFPFDFLLALVVSLPLYVCATGSIPIAVALIEKGFSPGAALVFLIAGPATNTITLSFVRYKLGRKSFFTYLLSIVFLSLFAGLAFNFIWKSFGGTAYQPYALPYWLKLISGIILAFLIAKGFISLFEKEKMGVKNKVKVPDMHCKNCKRVIEEEIRKAGIKKFYISLDKKIVGFEGDKEKVIKAIEKAGYSVKEN